MSCVSNNPLQLLADQLAKRADELSSKTVTMGMEPGRSIVSEFDDGKLMLCGFSHFAKFTPDFLRSQFADGAFRSSCEQSEGMACC